MSGFSADELRAAVREVIREVLPDGLPGGTTVSVTTDAELDALVRRLADLCDDPEKRAALKDGRHDFRLGEPTGRARRDHDEGSRRARPAVDATRVDRGAVTERVVLKAAKAGTRLVLGPKAVLTPLARDRARVLGVEIEKES